MASQNKAAFITGANKGIGFETARGLGELGIVVVLGCRDEGKGREAADRLRSAGIKEVEAVRFDVNRLEDHQAIFHHLDKRFGKLDILVNNAGIWLEHANFGAPGGLNTTVDVTPDILRKTFETNFFAAVALTQVLLPLVRKAPAGRIVNLSSILGSLTLHSDPSSPIFNGKAFAYDSSKTALNAFTVHLAHALRDTKIKVNSAHPGWVKTDMGARPRRWKSLKGARPAWSWQRSATTARPADTSTWASRSRGDRGTRARARPEAVPRERVHWGTRRREVLSLSPDPIFFVLELFQLADVRTVAGRANAVRSRLQSGHASPHQERHEKSLDERGWTNRPTGRTTTAHVHAPPARGNPGARGDPTGCSRSPRRDTAAGNTPSARRNPTRP